MNTINDKVVVILGASSGIGEATVRLLADKGAKLVISSRREEKLRELADSLEECTIAYKAADVVSYEEVKAVIDMAVELHGRVDVLYNNAGIMSPAGIYQQTPTAACASDAAAPITGGLGAFSHQQAAPGIYQCLACQYYQRL